MIELGKLEAAQQPSEAADGFDLLVIGSGGAGVAAAIRGAELGKRVALVEAGTIGGVCVNVGCVPSKTLLRAAELNHLAIHNPFAPGLQIRARADWEQLVAQKDLLVRQMRRDRYEQVLAGYPEITLFHGHARLVGARQVQITPLDAAGPAAASVFTPGNIVLATGSRPWAPPIQGLQDAGYLDSTAALEMEQLPSSLIVIGASAVGLELGQLFARFGTQVTVLEIQDRILPEEEPALGEKLAGFLRAEGLAIETGVELRSAIRRGGGYELAGAQSEAARTFRAEALLVAAGRRPATAGMGLEQAGVQLGGRGEVLVNEQLQSSNPRVYAAGDVLGREMFVYTAAYGGKLAAENALNGVSRVYDPSVVPRVTFTDPALASVGLTEAQARQLGRPVKASSLPLELISRAQANGDLRGQIKLVADRDTDRLLGAHVLAAEAGEVVQSAALAIRGGLTVADLQDTLFPYLTMVEGLRLAALSFDKDPAMLSCCAG